MASPVPAKSQPLHNFALPHLKWKKNHTNNHHRGRRHSDSPSPHRSPPPDSHNSSRRQSPLFDSAPRQSPLRPSASESDSGKNGVVVSENKRAAESVKLAAGFLATKSEKKSSAVAVSDVDIAVGKDKERRSKIYIRLRKSSSKTTTDDVAPEEGKEVVVKTVESGGDAAEESEPKTWNLRPRRPIRKLSSNVNGLPKVGGGGGSSSAHENHRAGASQSPARHNYHRPESEPNAAAAEKKEKKQKFSIPLSREEIEDDFYALTGSKPPRRPKKRAKIVQKQLDNLFPGLWLALITPDSYKVAEAPAKG